MVMERTGDQNRKFEDLLESEYELGNQILKLEIPSTIINDNENTDDCIFKKRLRYISSIQNTSKLFKA